jgi:inorganic pyrophosphatase
MKKFEQCTELELHVLQALRDDGEPIDLEYIPKDIHILQEFVDAYKTGAYIFEDSTEEDRKLLADFIKIVEEDIDGHDYTPSNFMRVMEAIRFFGL